MRKFIAALQVSLDGFIEGAAGQLDWVDSWGDCFDLGPRIDACLLGGNMYPAYEQYWSTILRDPTAILPHTCNPATEGELAYARFSQTTPHYVLSTGMGKPAWEHTTVLRHMDDVHRLKQAPGKDIHVVGGATLVASLMKADLLDEMQLVVHPVLLGAGKPLFSGLSAQKRLKAGTCAQLSGGRVKLTYLSN